MKESGSAKVQDRREAISRLVNQHGYASIEFLAEQCGVSTQTIRRDIQALSKENLLTRHHGGASPASSVVNTSYDVRRISLISEKRTLAREVIKQLRPSRSLFLTAGSTMEIVARELTTQATMCVITNNLHAAMHLYREEEIELLMPSGRVRTRNGGIVGPSAIEFVANFRTDYMVMGVGAISPEGLLLEYDYNEAMLMKKMMQNANEVILVMDSTKFERTATVQVGNLADVDILITDKEPPQQMMDIINAGNVRVVIPEGIGDEE